MVVRRFTPAVLAVLALIAAPAASDAAPRDRYERVLAQEQALRLDGPRPSPLSHIRRTMAAYESITRRYPTSGYADNALYQAAQLARAAHRVYGSELDRDRAVRLLEWLVREYPASSLRPRAQALLREVPTTRRARNATRRSAPARPATPAPSAPEPELVRASRRSSSSSPAAAAVAGAGTPPPGAAATALPPAVLRGVRREVVGDLVRVTLVFDGEVAYQHEELADPARIYVDLERTSTTPELQDAVLAFDGPAAHQIRLGRPRSDTTRVVIDTKEVSRYSVFALYNPYRLTIDLVPRGPALLRARAVSPIGRVPMAVPKPVAVLAHVEPERLAPRPLPHPLADRPLAEAVPVRSHRVAAALVPPVLATRSLDIRALAAQGPIAGRPVSAPVHAYQAAQAARHVATPLLATRDTAPAALPAPSSPVPNSAGGFSIARQLGLGISRIVIDPGHGGHDPGAMAQRTTEAEVVLDVALRLEKLLEKEPGVDVVLTRRTNVFVPLEERTAMANRDGADLFLSIHVNSSRNTRAGGVETYFLNFANDSDAEAVAARENATAARAMHQLPDMVRAISLNNKMDESRDFARTVQESLVDSVVKGSATTRDRGVKQAPFVVLIGAGMPSVLAEIAFITNPEEGGKLRTAAYRQQIAQALFEALRKYQRSLKAVGTVASQ